MRNAPLLGLASLLLAAATAAAQPAPAAVEPAAARFAALWVEPIGQGGARRPGCLTLALLNLPPAWQPGDAAVVVLAPRRAAEAPRLAAALLREEAAVLELPPDLACEEARGPAAPVPPAADWLRGGLDSLRRDLGAGLTVVVGVGPEAGPAALAAAREGRGGPAPRAARDAAARVVAAGAVEGAQAVFEMGAAPTPQERWALRAPLLCAALEGALPPLGGEACRAALVPPGPPTAARPEAGRLRQAAR